MKILIFFIISSIFSGALFSGQVANLPELDGDPQTIVVDGDRLYVTRTPGIFVYSLPDVKFLKEFGKAGKEPGEFVVYGPWSLHITPMPTEILVSTPGRISFFTRDGDFLRLLEIDKKVSTNFRVKPLGKNYVAVRTERMENKGTEYRFCIFDAAFKKIKELSRCWLNNPAGKTNPTGQSPILPFAYVYKNRIFLSKYHNEEGIIEVFDGKGNKLYVIDHEYEKIKFDKQAFLNEFKTPEEKAYFEKNKDKWLLPVYNPAWQNFVIDNGKIYLQTFKRNKEKTKNEFIIMGLDGKILKRVWLPLLELKEHLPHSYTIKDNTLYQLNPTGPGKFEVHINKIEKD